MMKSTFNRRVGKWMRSLRLENNETQKQIGEVLGCCFQNVQRFESGLNGVSAYQLMKLEKHFQAMFI